MTRAEQTVLQCLGTETRSGRELQRLMLEVGCPKTGPAFYAMMSGLKHQGYVESWNEPCEVVGYPVTVRYYKRTGKGHHALAGSLQDGGRGRVPGEAVPA